MRLPPIETPEHATEVAEWCELLDWAHDVQVTARAAVDRYLAQYENEYDRVQLQHAKRKREIDRATGDRGTERYRYQMRIAALSAEARRNPSDVPATETATGTVPCPAGFSDPEAAAEHARMRRAYRRQAKELRDQ